MPKITVAIPCYNAKDTLRATLHSIAMQSIADEIEVIVVNDCDNFGYVSIISCFPELNIKYIKHEVNKGCGGSRNTGIRNATGDYICFVDSDDQLTSSLSLEVMYGSIVKADADMLVSVFESEGRFTDGIAVKKMERVPTWTHGKLYRRQFLVENELYFNENLRLNEDAEFNQLVLDLGAKVVEIPMVTLTWRDNPKSLTHESLYKNKLTFIDACMEYIKDCNKRELMNERVVVRVLQNLDVIYTYYNIVLDDHEDKADEFLARCKEYWQLCKNIVADVDDEMATKVYLAVMKDFKSIPSVGYIEFLNELRIE